MKKRSIFYISIFVSLFLSGCKYDFILPAYVAPITGPVSFSTYVVPIFKSSGGNCVACHKTGGQAPDYSGTDVYSQIVPSLIDSNTPANSKIYSYPAPTTGTHTWKKYTPSEAAIVLQWIKEGAKNN